jgi:glycosyltransferase involved in cell wall biosynthesis
MIDAKKPDVIHFHPLHADDTVGLVESVAHRYPVITSYHTPTVSCDRGNLLLFGEYPCDGEVQQQRCCACVFQQKGLSRSLSRLLGAAPVQIYSFALRLPFCHGGRLKSMLNWPRRLAEHRDAFKRMCAASRRVVAVSEWVKDLLIRNGIPGKKIKVIRYGREIEAVGVEHKSSQYVRFGYIGRLTGEKGVRTLLDAIRMIGPEVRFAVEFVSPAFDHAPQGSEDELLASEIRRIAETDKRVLVRGGVQAEKVGHILVEWDALIVPSLWMETGPQVVTEAFSVRTPVIGSRRGGIMELVRDGVDGILFPPGDTRVLVELLTKYASDPTSLRAMRGQVLPVRTAGQMAEEVHALYEDVMRGTSAN